MNVLSPFFLMAMPQMEDPRFSKSVILILEHDSKGATGLVLNHPVEVSLGAFALNQNIPCKTPFEKQPIYLGGPLETDRGWILHEMPDIKEKKPVVEGVWISRSRESLTEILSKEGGECRFILGHAAWSPGQLESELQYGSWLMNPANKAFIFHRTPQNLWELLLQEMQVDPAQLVTGAGIH